MDISNYNKNTISLESCPYSIYKYKGLIFLCLRSEIKVYDFNTIEYL
jgi:hypothetical protein